MGVRGMRDAGWPTIICNSSALVVFSNEMDMVELRRRILNVALDGITSCTKTRFIIQQDAHDRTFALEVLSAKYISRRCCVVLSSSRVLPFSGCGE